MVEPKSKFTQELIGSEIVCPVCRDETTTVRETKKEVPFVQIPCQHSPLFLNYAKRLPDEVLPDTMNEGQEEDELEQNDNPWTKDTENKSDDYENLAETGDEEKQVI